MAENRSILARFTSVQDRQIRCCHAFGPHLYLGTGPEGIVYRSTDGFSFSEFYKTGEYYATAIADYGNALFVGTSSNGYIMMHNFNTGNRFNYVITGDYQVTSFAVHNDKLYAGTSPSGMVFSFDGNKWVLEYDSYGGGIKSMISDGEILYVFVEGVEFIPCLKSSGWQFLKNGDVSFSVSSFSKVSTSLPVLANNKNFDTSFSCACVHDSKAYFAPYNRCNLYVYDGQNVSIAYQWSGTRITAIESVGDKQLVVAVDDTVYLMSESVDASVSLSSGSQEDAVSTTTSTTETVTGTTTGTQLNVGLTGGTTP